MSFDRRTVRATPEFFVDLDAQLSPERGPNGEPSTHDFQVVELLRLVDEFATGFDELPSLYAGVEDYRVLITAGLLVSRIAVTGRLCDDGAIELVSLDIDTKSGWD